ncbi:MAG: pyridoxamine 5'-phosphate oxidase family protein [Pseudonocardiaceae bacterium]
MSAHEDRPELRVLSADDCYQLLATRQIGRLGVNAEHYPVIFPVNYALDRVGVIVIRTNAGTKLCRSEPRERDILKWITSISRLAVAGACSCAASPRK